MDQPRPRMIEDEYKRWSLGRVVALGLAAALLVTALLLWVLGFSIWAVVPIAVLTAAASGAVLSPFASGMVAGAMMVVGAGGAALILGLSHGQAWHGAAFAGLAVIAGTAPGAALLAGWQRRQITKLSEELDATDALLRATQVNTRLQPDPAAWTAFYDPVTGLAARRLVLDRFGQAMAHAERTGTLLGILLFELGLPPALRAEAAHDAAQEAIRQAGQRLMVTLRRGDTAGRLEGLRFVILLDALTEAGGLDVAEGKLREALTAPMTLPGQPHPLAVTLYGGGALFPRDGVAWDELLTFAARNLQAAQEVARLTAGDAGSG